MELPAFVEKYWTQLCLTAGGLFAALKWWRSVREKRRDEASAERAARHAAKVDLTRLAQEVAAEAIQTLRDELHRQSLEIDELRKEIHDMQSAHIRSITEKDAEIAIQRGRIRQLEAERDIFRRLLTDHRIPVPLTFEAQQVRPDGNLGVMGGGQ